MLQLAVVVVGGVAGDAVAGDAADEDSGGDAEDVDADEAAELVVTGGWSPPVLT